MTGGGDCPGLNAVIRAAVRVGKERFGWEILGVEDAFSGLIDLDYKSPHGNLWLEPSHVRGILERNASANKTSIVIKQPCMWNLLNRDWGPVTTPPVWIENLREELNAPGQSYYDRMRK